MAVETNMLPPRYRGARRIGRGGMGDIYRATDEVLGRDVAIKLLAERYASDDSVRERFKREALAAARLSGHPSIVTIFDVGEHDGRPFIVMEYLAGGSLEDRVRDSGAREPARTLDCLDEAADALDYAHDQGIVHRDVKPANLLLDNDGHVHVADFGIASAAGFDSLTMTGTVLGTAAYLAPEQAQGQRATPASDRYALAAVAYELLAGERPFGGDTPAAEAMAHVNAPVPSVSARRGDLPRQLDEVFERGLAKRPEERYPSCRDFVAALRHALYAESPPTQPLARVAAPPPPVPRRRSRVPLALGLLALLGLGLLGVVLATGAFDDGGEAGEQEEAAPPTTTQPQPPQVTTVVRTVTQEGQTQRVTVTAQPQPQPAPPPPTQAAPQQGGLSVAQARALQDESTAEMRRGNWERALALAQQALPALQGRDRTYEGYANFNIGNSLSRLGRCEEALPYLQRREQLLGPHADVTAAKRRCGA